MEEVTSEQGIAGWVEFRSATCGEEEKQEVRLSFGQLQSTPTTQFKVAAHPSCHSLPQS